MAAGRRAASRGAAIGSRTSVRVAVPALWRKQMTEPKQRFEKSSPSEFGFIERRQRRGRSGEQQCGEDGESGEDEGTARSRHVDSFAGPTGRPEGATLNECVEAA